MSRPKPNTDDFGKVVLEDGSTVIPASRRPDGTMRKEIRVKAGYVPPDEQVRYVSRGKAFAESNRSSLPVGMTSASTEPKAATMSKSQKKNAKRKESKTSTKEEDALADKLAGTSLDGKPAASAPDWLPGTGGVQSKPADAKAEAPTATAAAPTPTPAPSSEDPAKKVKNLQKKLRQIEELRAQVEKGEVVPNDEQKDKLSKEKELRDQIAQLQKQ